MIRALLAALLLVASSASAQDWSVGSPVEMIQANFDQTFTHTFTQVGSTATNQDLSSCAQPLTLTVTGPDTAVSVYDCPAADSAQSACTLTQGQGQGSFTRQLSFSRGFAKVRVDTAGSGGTVELKCNQVPNETFTGGSWQTTYGSGGGGGGPGNVALNTPIDRNGDGRDDYILVGDYDNDGTLEFEDIVKAHDDLRISTGAIDISASAVTLTRNDGGDFTADGFTAGMEVKVSGFGEPFKAGASTPNIGNLGEAIAVVDNCSGSGFDCFQLASGTFDSALWRTGMTVYTHGFANRANQFFPPNMAMVMGVSGDELRVDADLTAEAAGGDEFLRSDGDNRRFIANSVTNDMITLQNVGGGFPSLAGDYGNQSAGDQKVQDTAPITLELIDGEYVAPTGDQGDECILCMDSYLTIRGTPRSVVHTGSGGAQGTNAVGFGTHVKAGASYLEQVTLEGFTTDGDWSLGNPPACNFCPPIGPSGVRDLTVRNVNVRDTGHSCIYWANGQNVVVEGNRGDDCGNNQGFAASAAFPCIYAFQNSLGWNSRNTIRDNICQESRAPGLNFRREAASGDSFPMNRLEMINNVIRNSAGGCFNAQGISEFLFEGTICDGAYLNFPAGNNATEYNSDSTAQDGIIRGTIMRNADNPSGPPVIINSFNQNIVFEALAFEGETPSSGLVITLPNRGLVIRDSKIDLRRAKSGGNAVFIAAFTGREAQDENEYILFDNVTIHGNPNGGETVYVSNQNDNIFWVDSEILGSASNNGVIYFEPNTGTTARWEMLDSTISGLHPGFIGRVPKASVPKCDQSLDGRVVLISDAQSATDCNEAGPTDGTDSGCDCQCESGTCAWTSSNWSRSTRSCIFQGGNEFGDQLHDSKFVGVTFRDCPGGYGLSMATGGPQSGNVYQSIMVRDNYSGGSGADAIPQMSGGLAVNNFSTNFYDQVICENTSTAGGPQNCIPNGLGNASAMSRINNYGDPAGGAGVCTPGMLYRRIDAVGLSLWNCDATGTWQQL